MDESYYQQLLTRVDTTIAKSQQSSHSIYAGAYYDDRPTPSLLQYIFGYNSLIGPFVLRGEYLGLSRCYTLFHALMGLLLGIFFAGIFRFGSAFGEIILCSVFLMISMMSMGVLLVTVMKSGSDKWKIFAIILVAWFALDLIVLKYIGPSQATRSLGIFLISYLVAASLEIMFRAVLYKKGFWPGVLVFLKPTYIHEIKGPQEDDVYASLDSRIGY